VQHRIDCIVLIEFPTDFMDLRSVSLETVRTVSADGSTLTVRNCHAAQLGRVYCSRSCNSNSLKRLELYIMDFVFPV